MQAEAASRLGLVQASGLMTSATTDQLGNTMKRSRNGWIFLLGILLVLGGQAFAATQDIKAEPGTGLAFGADKAGPGDSDLGPNRGNRSRRRGAMRPPPGTRIST